MSENRAIQFSMIAILAIALLSAVVFNISEADKSYAANAPSACIEYIFRLNKILIEKESVILSKNEQARAQTKAFDLPGYPLHVVQRGNNRQAVFFEDADYRAYLDWLRLGARQYGVAVHAWCLMTNHVHVLVTPRISKAVPRLFAYLGRHYVSYINHVYGRTGSLWEGRYRASLVDSEGYLLACYRYIELNPVRAGMVLEPSLYRWSSYRVNGLGLPSELVTPHEVYRSLGSTEAMCCEAYRGLFEQHLSEEMVTQVEVALMHNHVLGNPRFKAEVERMLKRRLGRGGPGRPRKDGGRRGSDAETQDARPRRGSQHRLL